VVFASNEFAPIAVFPTPVVVANIALYPMAVFNVSTLPEGFIFCNACSPIATFLSPATLVVKASVPIATLVFPVVRAIKASLPIAILLPPVVAAVKAA